MADRKTVINRIIRKDEGVDLKASFEDDFMDIQSGLVSLCLELSGNKVDKVYAYASIEKKSSMF